MSIDFLVIGHFTRDRVPDGFKLGGTASYAAVTALRLGCKPGVLTRGRLDGIEPDRTQFLTPELAQGLAEPLAGISLHLLPSTSTTTFANIYHDGTRTQVLEAVAEPIPVSALPAAWREPGIVLLGPLVAEVPPDWHASFPGALLGVTPQGWMRAWDDRGYVHPVPWQHSEELLARADAVVLSRDDCAGDEKYIETLAALTQLLVVTDGWHGAAIYHEGRRTVAAPRRAVEVDPTGAGDVFSAAFLIRLSETGDPLASARFANVVASFSVEAPGFAAIPTRATVERWLAKHDGTTVQENG